MKYVLFHNRTVNTYSDTTKMQFASIWIISYEKRRFLDGRDGLKAANFIDNWDNEWYTVKVYIYTFFDKMLYTLLRVKKKLLSLLSLSKLWYIFMASLRQRGNKNEDKSDIKTQTRT